MLTAYMHCERQAMQGLPSKATRKEALRCPHPDTEGGQCRHRGLLPSEYLVRKQLSRVKGQLIARA